jgi:hypothetical protein
VTGVQDSELILVEMPLRFRPIGVRAGLAWSPVALGGMLSSSPQGEEVRT